MLSKGQMGEILLDIGAVSLNPSNPFRYASGILSPIYTDCRLIASNPEERTAVVDTIVQHLIDSGVKSDIVVGTGMSGTWLAAHVSGRLRLPMAYVRTKMKNYGRPKQIEGHISKGQNALLVADIMSTEPDIPEAVDALKSVGAVPIYCVAIFTNNIGKIEGFLNAQSIRFYTITDLSSVLSVASSKGKISPEDKALVQHWALDPKEWQPSETHEPIKLVIGTREEMASILLEIQAARISTRKPYTFSSGMLSPIYIDSRLIISRPIEWQRVLSLLEMATSNEIGTQNVSLIAGTATAGIPHAACLADKLSLPSAYVKSSAEEHGKRSRIEGRIRVGDRALVVEDVVTTGKSVISAATALRDAGAVVNWCLCIFTYHMQEAWESFDKAGISLLALTDLSSLLRVALERGLVSEIEAEDVMTWVKNPWTWSKDTAQK